MPPPGLAAAASIAAWIAGVSSVTPSPRALTSTARGSFGAAAKTETDGVGRAAATAPVGSVAAIRHPAILLVALAAIALHLSRDLGFAVPDITADRR
jgi:hypothetical protein